MADAKHGLEFLERGVRMFFYLRLKFLGVEFAPMSPALFRSQRTIFGGGQIPIHGTPGQIKPPGRLGFRAAALNEFYTRSRKSNAQAFMPQAYQPMSQCQYEIL
jgi:hypothetical protein